MSANILTTSRFGVTMSRGRIHASGLHRRCVDRSLGKHRDSRCPEIVAAVNFKIPERKTCKSRAERT